MLSEQTHEAIKLKMNEVNYLWHDSFRPDLGRFLDKLSVFKELSVDYSHSFASLFFAPKKGSSGYGLNKRSDNTLRDEQGSAPTLRR